MSGAGRRQRGYTAILAIVFVVLLASVGAVMVTTSGVQHMSTALSWYGMQTWLAARSAMEWAAARATASQASHDALCDSPATVTTFSTALAGRSFQLTVSCDDQDASGFTEAGLVYEVDAITVTATHGTPGEVDYASRTIEGRVSRGEPLP